MRVLHVITGLAPGGAEQQLLDVARGSRHDTEVLALCNVGAVGERLRASGVPVHDLRMRSNRDVGVLRRLAGVMRGGRFTVVHVHLYRACVYGRAAAARARVPLIVTTEHSLGETLLEGRRINAGVRALYRATDLASHCTIAVSGAVRDRLVAWGIRPHKIIVIPNGIDVDAFAFDPARRERVRTELGVARHETVFGTIGRLMPSKGHGLTLAALAPLLRDGTRLVIAGAGPEAGRLARDARTLGVGARVHLLGERVDAADLLAGFDVFIAAPQPGEETFGLSAVEALAAGLPLVTTYCPALDGIRDSRIVRCDRTADGIAAAASAARAASAHGRENRTPPALVERFRIDAVVRAIDDVYDETARVRRRRSREYDPTQAAVPSPR